MSERVRDAMLTDPRTLSADASAQEAAQLLARPEVRAVLVCDEGRLVGLVGAAELVAGVVAEGRDPRTTPLRDIARRALVTVEPSLPIEEAYRVLEERDLERVPVTENGRLVGVLSRSVLQRRLAEDDMSRP
ncbi:MAG: CBS domain-containing protein [Actinobacteria bacterium]|nr:CBS domain-containing protein [Actinomycetota bacterium]